MLCLLGPWKGGHVQRSLDVRHCGRMVVRCAVPGFSDRFGQSMENAQNAPETNL
jgi:hypothetical protein